MNEPEMWVHFAAAALSGDTSASDAAGVADQMLDEYNSRYEDYCECAFCQVPVEHS